MASTSPSGPATGSWVGGYRLLSLLGEGGMGVVHLAEAPDGRRVALKVLRTHIVGDREARERLAREVGSLSRIRSHRVAEILDADAHGPVPFVVTRYVPGLSLHEHVREHGPSRGEDLRIVAGGLAEALATVHGVGVLHRDIKPSNVLMEGRWPVLIDFGLARLAEDPRLTATGFLLGTPGYLAPEVLHGDDASTATDVHAWAATVTFAGTGSSPYGTGPAMAVMDRVRRGEHRLSGLDDEVRPLVEAALSVEPHERPTLREIRVALERLDDPGADSAVTSTFPLTPRRPPHADQPTMPAAVAHAHEEHRRAEAPTDRVRHTGPRQVAAASATVAQAAASATSVPTRAVPPTGRTTPEAEPAWRRALREPPASIAPTPRQPVPWEPVHPETRRKHRLVTLSAGTLAAATVAFAPYLGALVVLLLVGTLRLASVASQRHRMRHETRGRRRWFDVPLSVVLSPGYLVISLVGTLVLAGWAAACATGAGVLLAIAGVPLVLGLLGVGAAFAAATWWGPGALRVRDVGGRLTRRAVLHPSVSEGVVALCLAVAVVLLAVLAASGPVWAPRTGAPWSSGLLAELSRVL